MGNTTVNVDVNTVSLTRDNYLVLIDSAIHANEVFAKRHQSEIEEWKADGPERNAELVKFLERRASNRHKEAWSTFETARLKRGFLQQLRDALRGITPPHAPKYASAISYLMNEEPMVYEAFLLEYGLGLDYATLPPWEALTKLTWRAKSYVENQFVGEVEALRHTNAAILRGTDAVFNIPRTEYDEYTTRLLMAEDPEGGNPYVEYPRIAGLFDY